MWQCHTWHLYFNEHFLVLTLGWMGLEVQVTCFCWNPYLDGDLNTRPHLNGDLNSIPWWRFENPALMEIWRSGLNGDLNTRPCLDEDLNTRPRFDGDLNTRPTGQQSNLFFHTICNMGTLWSRKVKATSLFHIPWHWSTVRRFEHRSLCIHLQQ